MFEFPRIHLFPPLYTRQPNATVLDNQLASWATMILDYCQFHRITAITGDGGILHSQLEDISPPPLFENKEISRKVSDSFRKQIFDHLVHIGKAEYIDAKKPEKGLFVYWKSLAEWSKLLYDYVDHTGQLGTVMTVYELTKSEDLALPEDLRNLSADLLERILKSTLVKQGKAQIILEDNGAIGGVKIV